MAAISARNFQSNSLSGAVSVTNGFANIILPTNAFALEGNKSFVIKLRKGSIQGDVIATSPTITLQDNSSFVSLTANTATVNEGNLVSFTLVTANAVNGATLFYSVNPVTANLTFSDFYNGSNTGYATIIDNQATFTLYANTDSGYADETGETFRIQLRTDSITGNVVYSSTSNVAITDFYKLYNILGFTESASSVTEGGTITLTFTAHNVPAGTLFYYYTDGNATTSTFTGGNTGSFIMNGTSNTITLPTLNVPYGTTQNFNVKVRAGSSTGTLYATSNTLIILDASLVDIVATGGDTVFLTGGYRVHTYNASSTFNVTGLGSSGSIEYLVIAGGGAGGAGYGGFSGIASGGGAGGYLEGSTTLPATGSYTITVGAGAAPSTNAARGSNGSNSNIFNPGLSVVALGGGGGGGGNMGGSFPGSPGGSGGGANSNGSQGSGTPGQGYPGGVGYNSSDYGGGGGGAGGAAQNGAPSYSSTGGPGATSSITGTSVVRAGGGTGGRAPNAGSGSPPAGGGGGTGGFGGSVPPTAGVVNSGGGGGGAAPQQGGSGGGSGIVIIRYPFSGQVFNGLTTTANTYVVGSNITFTLNLLNANTQTLYYSTDGNVDASYFIGGNTGSFIANATGNVFTLYANSSATVPLGQTRNFRLQIRQDSTTGFIFGNGSNVALVNSADYYINATGGNVTLLDGYKTHRFTTSSNLIITSSGIDSTAEVLVVGGGGGGGSLAAGGGGAGGLLYGTTTLTAITYSVQVGAGGSGGSGGNPNRQGFAGTPSYLGSFIGNGGGAGGGNSFAAGTPGGSGGGAASYGPPTGGSATQSPSGTLTGYGNPGGPSGGGGGLGGGGGAGGAGGYGATTNNGASPAPGGAGRSLAITGSNVTYGAGGAGGTASNTPGPANSGNGGPGIDPNDTGGTGGSGIVIVRYAYGIPYFTGLTISSLSSNILFVGSNITFDLAVQGANTRTLYYTTEGNVESTYFIGGNTGSFVANAIGSVITLRANSSATIPTGQTRNFRLQVRQDSTTGFVSISSANVVLINSADYYMQATGGNILIANGYKTHTFTSSGNLNVTGLGFTSTASNAEILVVAGGGGGGIDGGGGGGGGLLYGNINLSAQNYTVIIGGGGAPDPAGFNPAYGQPSRYGLRGGNTTLSPSILAIGGGGGAGGYGGLFQAGGSGAGGHQDYGTHSVAGLQGPSGGLTGYKGNGATYNPQASGGGGGGGAGGNGSMAPPVNGNGQPGAGGAGFDTSISGSPVVYSAGGRGKLFSAGVPAPVSTIGTLAQNIGAGGTAGGGDSQTGSPGIVIIRYPFVGQYFAGLTISPLSSNSISQGANAIFDLSVQGANNITYYYTTNGNVNASHFIGGNTGSFVANTTGAIIRLQSNTNIPSGETRNFSIDVRQTSVAGTVLISSPNVIINGPLAGASTARYLVVAGGGGGGRDGNYAGPGGGAGGLLYGSSSVTPGTPYTVTVGAGGVGSGPGAAASTNGANSIISGSGFTTLTAVGGGGGANQTISSAKNGGSGGGRADPGFGGSPTVGTGYGYPGTIGSTQQGYPGGYGGGGAGGAGAQNTAGGQSPFSPGGVGLTSDITGATVYYAGGGGAGSQSNPGAGNGGNGGGGAGKGASTPGAAANATINTGGGGGGGYGASGSPGGLGGSGVVILAHPTAYATATTSGANVSVVTVSGNIIYKFFASGTITF